MGAPDRLDAIEEMFSSRRWIIGEVLVPLLYAVGVIVQRGDEPHLGRTIVLVVIGMAPLLAHDLLHCEGTALGRIPAVVWSLPAIAAVLLLVWEPVNGDLAPFLLLLISVRAAVVARFLDGLAVAFLSGAVMAGVEAAGHFQGAFTWVLGITFAWLGGFAFRYLMTMNERLRVAQAGLAERAAADERERIAREIHDVVAHSLSVAALHITGARMALKRSPEEAAAALEQAETLARDSMSQVRAAIGVLSPATDGTAAAMPTAEDVPRLVSEFVAAGAHVELDIDGSLTTLSPSLSLTVYRVTQESLSNVVRHSASHEAVVRIARLDGAV
jgi:signal transduction histidine kinase